MVVGDFHLGGAISFPVENDAPLVIDADGMEAIQLPPESLQAVPWRVAEVIEGVGFMDGDELVIGTFLNFARKFTGELQMKNLFTLFVPEAQNHGGKLLKTAYKHKRKLLKSAYFRS
jgi:hypothetical protein